MSRLILIRHAQASFSLDPSQAFEDYDQLSPLGLKQAQALGEELAASGALFDRVIVGPSHRHRQTADEVAAVYERLGLPWPDPELSEELAEHEGARVVQRAVAQPQYDEELVRLVGLDASLSDDGVERQRNYFAAFRRVTRQWARQELPAEITDGASWQAFRARVQAGVESILERGRPGETVAVFTSGGPVGSTVAWVLGLDDEQALEFAWTVQNATLTELLYREDRVSLKSFNVHPRLGSPELATYV